MFAVVAPFDMIIFPPPGHDREGANISKLRRRDWKTFGFASAVLEKVSRPVRLVTISAVVAALHMAIFPPRRDGETFEFASAGLEKTSRPVRLVTISAVAAAVRLVISPPRRGRERGAANYPSSVSDRELFGLARRGLEKYHGPCVW